MSTLNIYMLGEIKLIPANFTSPVHMTHSVQRLLAYLVLQRHRSHSREVLAGLFWGDQSQKRARNCLNTTLWRLRQALEPYETPRKPFLMNSQSGEIAFNPNSDYWLDLDDFESQSKSILRKPIQEMQETDVHCLQETLQLYHSDLLQGFYDDWALRERERIRSLRLSILSQLMQYSYDHQEYQSSLEYGRMILVEEPLREEIHRLMMMNYLALGERTLAIQQYLVCREQLESELGILPMEETQLFYLHLREDNSLVVNNPTSEMDTNPFLVLLSQAQLTLDSLNETRSQLHRLLQLIEKMQT